MNKQELCAATEASSTGISQLIREDIQALSAYSVSDANGMIKLDAMENPYPLPSALVETWLQSMRALALNRYPDPTGTDVIKRIRAVMSIDDGFDVLLGNGSDEIIQMLCTAVAKPGAVVLSPTPSFVMYKMIAGFCGLKFVGVPLTESFELDEQTVLKVIKELNPALIFLSYPNNPSGNLFDQTAMRRIIESSSGLVIIDEAYYIFSEHNTLSWLAQYSNLLIMRTLSKLGLAGLRLGMLIGSPKWLQQLNKVRLPYNINTLTQASAAFILDHWQVLYKQIQSIVKERERVTAQLGKIKAITVFPSEANFILIRTPKACAEKYFSALKEKGILVKCLSNAGVVKDCLRITVGSAEENDQLIKNLREITNDTIGGW